MIIASRRQFLQGIAAAAIAATVPAAVALSEKFDPATQYGNAASYAIFGLNRIERDEIERAMAELLAENARKILPPGTRFEIRAMYSMDYGRLAGMAWFYDPYMAKAAEWLPLDKPIRDNYTLGYILQARMTS